MNKSQELFKLCEESNQAKIYQIQGKLSVLNRTKDKLKKDGKDSSPQFKAISLDIESLEKDLQLMKVKGMGQH